MDFTWPSEDGRFTKSSLPVFKEHEQDRMSIGNDEEQKF